jgi:hypothetical protein
MRKIAIVILIIVTLFLSGCAKKKHVIGHDDITIAYWNIQFSPSGAISEPLFDYYVGKISNYTICIIHGLKDTTNKATSLLITKFPDRYQYVISEMAGSAEEDEQCIVFFDTEKVILDSYYDYSSELYTLMERPPLQLIFVRNDWVFSVFTMHVFFANASRELTFLEQLATSVPYDAIVIGSLGTDVPYYNENVKEHFLSWNWTIGDKVDTTSTNDSSTYDRIIINKECEDNFRWSSVMKDVTKYQSPNYLIYGVFNPRP